VCVSVCVCVCELSLFVVIMLVMVVVFFSFVFFVVATEWWQMSGAGYSECLAVLTRNFPSVNVHIIPYDCTIYALLLLIYFFS
jgi:hypothetical protein